MNALELSARIERYESVSCGMMGARPVHIAADLSAFLVARADRDLGFANAREIALTLPRSNAVTVLPEIARLGDRGGGLPMEEGVIAFCEEAHAVMAEMECKVTTSWPLFDPEAIRLAWFTLRSFRIAGGHRHDCAVEERSARLTTAMILEIEQGLTLSAMDVHLQSEVCSDRFRTAIQALENVDVMP